MQGKKSFTSQLFVSVNLLDLVPEDNFYRKMLSELNLDFIYKATQKYYDNEVQKLPLFFHQQKNKYFSPSSIPETSEELCFCEISLFRLQ